MAIVEGRMIVDNAEGLVVFLIGARVNSWWRLPLVLPVLASMRRMLDELARDPESGFLGVQSLGFGGMVQYTNMPRFGMGTWKPLVPATGARGTAEKRLAGGR